MGFKDNLVKEKDGSYVLKSKSKKVKKKGTCIECGENSAVRNLLYEYDTEDVMNVYATASVEARSISVLPSIEQFSPHMSWCWGDISEQDRDDEAASLEIPQPYIQHYVDGLDIWEMKKNGTGQWKLLHSFKLRSECQSTENTRSPLGRRNKGEKIIPLQRQRISERFGPYHNDTV